ncbi:methyl-accepting chemotaxis protein [Paenibacillus thalictri]|uniref:Methyl-accepting chemotaxis protein n=1 Tax=Paenibacillus thalictri TaxID=2527873 RepID=A0A4Q9DGE4_9BACL|nr:methyl-accepting chemotaxis protein [Paenibacillus thalictri]TBL71217.1 methyl-accepting chemotaxis protein [Paenibacillus thalictri]
MTWYRNLRLSIKLIGIVCLILVIIFTTMIGFNLNQLRTVSLSKGMLEANEAGNAFSTQFEDNLVNTQSMLQTMSTVLLDARNKKRLSREDVTRILGDLLDKHPDYIGIYTAWEPNAFDNNDKANAKLHAYDDDSGRFVPYIARNGDKKTIEPLKDYELSGAGNYYQLPKKSKKLVLMEPYTYQVGDKKVLMTSLVLPILDESGNFVGIVGVDFPIDSLQKKAAETKPNGGYMTIVSSVGNYIANGNSPESVGKSYIDTPEKQRVWEELRGGKLQNFSINSSGDSVLRTFLPIQLSGSDQTWYVETVIPEQNVLSTYRDNMLVSVSIAIFSLLLLAALLIVIIRYMVVRNIQRTVETLGRLAGGDFTFTLPVRGKDEFGQMARHFNETITKLRTMLQMVTDMAMSVGATSQQLTASAEQTSKAAETITQSIQETAIGAEASHNHLEESAKTMSDLSAGVQRIAESSYAVSESAEEVTKQTEQGNAALQEAIGQMGVVSETVRQSEQAMLQLERRSEEIEGIVSLITTISTQTNLLALNAAIEAARVGEHGKGFAVVATEVRKLAEQTKTAAEQVSELIGEIRQDTKSAAAAMAQGSVEVGKGVVTVEDSGKLFASILTEIQSVNIQIQEVSAAAEQMSAGTQQIAATVEQLSELSSGTSASSQNVAAASEEQLASMEEISSSSSALSAMVQELLDRLSQFKL